MGRPVVHFEVIGREPARLREYYGALFEWQFDDAPTAVGIAAPGTYGFVDQSGADGGAGIPGGVGGGADFVPHALFYVGVPNVESALQQAESLGGRRVFGPARNEGTGVVVGHFTDPEGNLVGVAGPA